MLIKAKCHSQLLYTSSSFLHSTPPLPHSSLHPLLKPTFLFIVSLFPTLLDSLSFLAYFAASLLLPLPCHPILPPSPASFIPPPHYFTSPPAVFPLFLSTCLLPPFSLSNNSSSSKHVHVSFHDGDSAIQSQTGVVGFI